MEPATARDAAADCATLEAHYGGSPLHVEVEASGLLERVSIPRAELLTFYLPLLHAFAARAAAAAPARVIVGVAGAAGSGKSTTSGLLVALANALALAATGAPFPLAAAISMDGYHLTNAELVERGLRARKGVVETIHGTALAGDLELLRAAAAPAPRAPPPASAADPLGGRASWAGVDADGSILFPIYDRAVTHDPKLCAQAVPRAARLVFVEGLFVARGDGRAVPGPLASALPPDERVVGPDPTAWARVLAALDEIVLLAVPLALCRARCLQRRLRAVRAEGAAAEAQAAKLAATASHYERNDAPTWRAVVEGDAHRASLIVRVPLPPALAAACAAAAGDALAVPPESIVDALEADSAAAEARGDGIFAGATVERRGEE